MAFHTLRASLSWDLDGACIYTPIKTNKPNHKENKKMTQDRRQAPDMPEMRWNRDGTPNFDHLNQPDPVVEQIQVNRDAENENVRRWDEGRRRGVPAMPTMKWHRLPDGNFEPDFSELYGRDNK